MTSVTSKGLVSYLPAHCGCLRIRWEHFVHLLPLSDPSYEEAIEPDDSDSHSEGENKVQKELVGARRVLNAGTGDRISMVTFDVAPEKALDAVVGAIGCEGFRGLFSTVGLTLREFL